MADTTITVGGDTRLLVRQIEQALSKNYKLANIDFQKGGQPLGKIKGQLGEFEKSLEASNARVVAFGASAGAIYLLQDAFKGLVNSTVQVEKTLADINVIFNRSEKELKSFGDSLFQIANDTSQSFDTTAKAALEFSRQGLGLEQTLKRTSDALVLARISGLSAADSVEALTAAVNSFSDAGLTTAQIVNKLAAVDARYAVSSADLAEAIKRVGSSASEAGVSLDQLIALVTSAQQTTARGGAVIGNSFKTIFTRLQRPKAIDELEEIGIQTRNVAGDTLPLIQILSQLAGTYDSLSSAQKSQTAELVGGVYQINVLKAVLSDLSKTYDSTFVGALRASSSATNEAEKRVASLTETLDSQINRVTNNLKRAGSVVGELTIGPALQNVLSVANAILEDFALSKEPESYGEKVANNFFKGLGNFLGGPGLIIGLTGVFQIFKRLSFFIADASKTILGLSQSASQQANLQTQISQTLQKNPALYQQTTAAAEGLTVAAQGYLNILRSINAELERQRAIGGTVAQMPVQTAVAGMAGRRNAPSARRRRASGYIPNFYDPVLAQEEKDARRKNATNPKAYYTKAVIGGVSQTVAVNDQEKVIPNFAGGRDTAIIPNYMPLSKVSRNASGGYVPNYAQPISGFKTKLGSTYKLNEFGQTIRTKKSPGQGQGQTYEPHPALYVPAKASEQILEALRGGGVLRFFEIDKNGKYLYTRPSQNTSFTGKQMGIGVMDRKTNKFIVGGPASQKPEIGKTPVELYYKGDEKRYHIGHPIVDLFSKGYVPNYAANPIGLSELRKIIQSKQFQSITYTKANGQTSQYNAAQWRVRRDKLVGAAPPSGYRNWTEFDAASNSVVLHTVKSGEADAKFRRFTLSNIKQVRANGQTYDINSSLMSSGYIPNFAGLSDAINREKMMTGFPASKIMAHFDKNGNPIAVTNKQHEPNGLRDLKSEGYVPNFAKKEPAFNPFGNAQELLKSKYPIAGENIPAPMYSEIEKAKQLLADEDAKKAKQQKAEERKKARAERSRRFFESKRIERENAKAVKAAQQAASVQYGQTQARSKTVSALAASQYQRAYSPPSSQLSLIRAGQAPAINLPSSAESEKGLRLLPRREFRTSQAPVVSRPISRGPLKLKAPRVLPTIRTSNFMMPTVGSRLPVESLMAINPESQALAEENRRIQEQAAKKAADYASREPLREERRAINANKSFAKSVRRNIEKQEKFGQRSIGSTYKSYGAKETQKLLAKLNAPTSNVSQTAASAKGGLPVGGAFGPAMTGAPSAKMQLGSFGASIGLSLAFSQLPLIADLLGVQGIYEDENKTQLSRKGSTISQVGMAGSFASAFLNPAVLQSLASIPRGAVTRGRAGLESIGSKIGGGEGLFKKGFLNASSLGPSNPYAAKAGMNKSMIESLTRQQSLLSKFSKAGKAIPFVGTGLTLAMGGLQGYQASQSGASFLESLVLGGLPTAGMLLGGAIGGIAGGPLGGIAGSAAGSYLGSSLSKTLISEQRLKQLEENRNTQIDLQEKSRRYKGSAATMLGLSAESIKRIPLEKTGAETDREYAQKIKASSDDYLNLRKQQAAQIIEDIGGIQAATRLLNESGGNIDKFSKTISKAYVNLGKSEAGGVFTDTTATAAAEASKQADIVAKAIKKFEGIKSLSPLLTDLRSKFDTLTAKTSLYLTALDSLQEKEQKRGETLIKNFGGGLEGYLDPKKNLDPLDKIQKSLQFLNDPRFARNTVERGRVAYGLLQSTTELGITLPPEQEKRLSAIFSQGFQDSLNRMTGMVQLSGRQMKDDFGLSRGVDLSRMAMVRRGKAAGGLTAAEQLFSGDETAAKIGIRNPLELQVRNLTQQQVEELRSRGRELSSIFSKIESVLAAAQEGRLEESKAREVLQKASRISFGAAFGADDKTIIADLKKLIDSLDIKTRNEAEKLNTFKVESTVSGNIEVGLSKDALEYLTFAKNFKAATDTSKKNSNGTVLPATQ